VAAARGPGSPPGEGLCGDSSASPCARAAGRKLARLGKSGGAVGSPWGTSRRAHGEDVTVPRRARVWCALAIGADSPAGDPAEPPTSSMGAGFEVGFREGGGEAWWG
jgi:hypothetical protein